MEQTPVRKATVKILVVQGIGKKIFRLGDTVKETDFQPKGKFDELIKEGRIQEAVSVPGVPTIESEVEKAKKAAAEKLAGETTTDETAKKEAHENARKEAIELGIEPGELSTEQLLHEIEAKKSEKAAATIAAEEKEKAINEALELEIEVSDSNTTEEIISLIAGKKAEARDNAINEALELEISISDEMSTEQIIEAVNAKKEADATAAAAEAKANAEKEELESSKIAAEAYKGGKSFVNAKGETKVVNVQADITVKELVKELESAKIEFNHIAPKVVLFAKWIAL